MLTMQGYVDEVRMRLSRYDVSAELDPGTLQLLVNRSRRDVQAATLQVYPERYARTSRLGAMTAVTAYSLDIAGGTRTVWSVALPTDFLTETAFFVDGTPPILLEARKVQKAELFQLLNNTWNGPTPNEPIYCIEKSTTATGYVAYVSAGTAAVANSSTELWYLAVLPDLQLYGTAGAADTEVRIGPDFEELVILCATCKAAQKLGFSKNAELIAADVQMNVLLMQENYTRAVDREKLMLPSRETIFPGVPISDNLAGG